MNEMHKNLEKMREIIRINQIVEKRYSQTNQVRHDGYVNLLTKYGTERDSTESYTYRPDGYDSEMMLTNNYMSNGLFAKIIDRPAEEALKHGFDLGIKDKDIENYIEGKLDTLEWESKASEAIKWARLYGGALIVMLVNDGGTLLDPLNWNNVMSIDELLVFDRTVVQPDYNGLYSYNPTPGSQSKFGKPEYYKVSSMKGNFTVHESRCLIFKNGVLPEKTNMTEYRYWGVPEYHRIKRQIRSAITSHGNGDKLLEKCVQAIYKMKGLSATLMTEEGEDQVLKRMQIIDMARGILNSMLIDADGEDYDFKQMSLSGVKDLLDASCNMLSAVTDIPQTILFGRSPAGMNSTGESDMENFYNMVERVQKLNLKSNGRVLIDLIIMEGYKAKKIHDIPDYKVGFVKLWSLSEKEQAELEKVKADTEYVKAQTAQIYIDTQVMDAKEVRSGLADSTEYNIEDLLDAEELDMGVDDDVAKEIEDGVNVSLDNWDSADGGEDDSEMGVGILTVHDGKILIGKRSDGKGWCGPGGHIKKGENYMDAAIRETQEEFGITPAAFVQIEDLDMNADDLQNSIQYLCTNFYGEVTPADGEMSELRWVTPTELDAYPLFPPFAETISQFITTLNLLGTS